MDHFRDLLHIAGMGSALGVGFNPSSPDPRQQTDQPQVSPFIYKATQIFIRQRLLYAYTYLRLHCVSSYKYRYSCS
jgi:hypothetical protein